MKKALVVGATGVVGRELVAQLCQHDNYDKIIVWARREINFSHEKLETKIINFDEISKLPSEHFDEIFCALGTTIAQAKSRENFTKVDFGYPFEIAKWGKFNGTKRFVLVSSPGANAASANFYLQVKGRAEAEISKLNYESLQIAHPPLIHGERADFRLGERLVILAFKLVPKFWLKTYQPLNGEQIARAIIIKAQDSSTGVQIYEPHEVLDGS